MLIDFSCSRPPMSLTLTVTCQTISLYSSSVGLSNPILLTGSVAFISRTCGSYNHHALSLFLAPVHSVLEKGEACTTWLSKWNNKSFGNCLEDCLYKARGDLGADAFGDFVTILWEIWNAGNRFVFAHRDHNPTTLSKQALAFVKHFRHIREHESTLSASHPSYAATA
ncbi:hypothetical protein Cgig2_026603 [Carnegiea gigantea]|uniref:Uncharacterized protein n=1 Tax=Carnegiea gigantea TaxID=171969 RepID=A0A9Q1KKA4_9CARY|nr:hypothetical protein Cgig2_026603 [Carnegiea gigantea]